MAQKIIESHLVNTIKQIIEEAADKEQPFMLFDVDGARCIAQEFLVSAKQYFGNCEPAISLKSCGLGLFCQAMADLGFSAEACSLEEMKLALAAGFTADRILFDGPLKLTNELEFALSQDIRVQVDSAEELKRIDQLCRNSERSCLVAMRLTHAYEPNIDSRFGVTEEEYCNDIVPYFVDNPLLKLAGFHLHTGSNQHSPEKITENLRFWLPFIKKYMPVDGYLDLGSGFPADSFCSNPSVATPAPELFFSAIKDVLEELTGGHYENWKIIFEPGRCISEDQGYYIGMVLGCKQRYGAQVFQSNLGKNWVPSIHNWHHGVTVLHSERSELKTQAQIVAGFNCFEADLVLRETINYAFCPGDHFIIRGCGAYDLQTGNEWTRRKPVIYALSKQKLITARLRQGVDAFARREVYDRSEQIVVASNIKLVTPSSVHAPELFRLVKHYLEYFSKFLAWPRFIETVHDTVAFLENSRKDHQDGLSKTFIILLDDVPCGTLSFNNIDANNKTVELGYWLSPQAQGQGILTQCIEVLIKHSSSDGAVQRFVIKCITSNKGSNGVARRCGFEHEGVLKKAEQLNGIFYDQNIYARVIGAK
jgi:ribosomal-protein-serine acetyltransferase